MPVRARLNRATSDSGDSMGKLSPQAALGFLLLLALASWGIVVAELALTGGVSVFALANAAVFTVTLAVWPLLTGMRISPSGLAVHPCMECGSPLLPIPRVSFCIHCGAYPKAKAAARAA